MNMHLYFEYRCTEVNYQIYNMGAPAIIYNFLKHKKRDYTVDIT